MTKIFAVMSATIFLACSSTTATLAQPTGHMMVAPSELTWVDMPTLPAGAKVAVIEGPLNEPVPFILRLKLPANYEIPAHWHPWIEHVTVISGTLNMGMGDKLDRSTTKALHAGSVAVIQASINHFSWTNDETIVQVHGIGPLVITYVNPADDPRNRNR